MNRKNRTIIVIAIAVLLGAAAAAAVYRAVQRIPVRQVEVASVYTVVAARTIPVGTMITKDHVRLAAWPARNQITGAFSKIEDVVNRGALTTISENEPLTDAKIAQPGAGAGLPPRIPPGMRAVSVKVNEVVGVAGFVLPGTRVDMLVTVEDPGTRGSQITRAVVNNLEVLTAGTRYDNEAAQAEGKAIQSSVVTLLATPQDAEKIALAATEGRAHVDPAQSARHAADRNQWRTPGRPARHAGAAAGREDGVGNESQGRAEARGPSAADETVDRRGVPGGEAVGGAGQDVGARKGPGDY